MTKRPLSHEFAIGSPKSRCRILFFGDLMGLTGDRVPRAAPAIQELFSSVDLVIGNCESPVVRRETNPFALHIRKFQMGSDYLAEFFDNFKLNPQRCALSVANNHSADCGHQAFEGSVHRLENLGITVLGQESQERSPITISTCSGLRLGITAWTHWSNRPITFSDPGPMQSPRVREIPWHRIRKEMKLDTLIASPHWEWEFQHFPRQSTYQFASWLANQGFDIIAGHHPHVVQPLEWFPGQNNQENPPALCQFSLGNLFGRTLTWPHRLLTLLEVHLSNEEENRGKIISYRCHPIVQMGAWPNTKLVPLRDAPDRLRRQITERLGYLFHLPPNS